VSAQELDFGAVFPQEKLNQEFGVFLSDSFLSEDRVDDVDYVVRQKPKCSLVATGTPSSLPPFITVTEDSAGNFVCSDEVNYDIMPLLCPYLSKHELTTDGSSGENDGASLPAFHGLPGPWYASTTLAMQVIGHLAKAVGDVDDRWNIDLKVPCFEGHCAQDWPNFVKTESGNPQINPNDYVQPLANEHKKFGCDLWVEVGSISLSQGCKKELDLMLVLDRSGSINSTELQTLKDAANAFVTTLAPTTTLAHIGQTSFSTSGSLDLHLTDSEAAAHAAINALVSGGLTNLAAGINLAVGELDNTHAHERPSIDDVIIIITDGNPNQPGGQVAGRAAASASADAARAAGIEVFVVGVGSDVDATYLKTDIADDDAHYFAAANFSDLQAVLETLLKCQP
jgi:uncharacterized protein YegL